MDSEKLPVLIQGALVCLLILYGINWSYVQDVGGDEKIYLVSAALLDADIAINLEHPPLVKWFYNVLLTPEYKQQIIDDESLRTRLLWIPNTYTSDYQHTTLLNGTRYLRLINGLLISIALLLIWWHSRNFALFVSLYSILLVSDQLFSILLDGWLFVGAVGGYYALSQGHRLLGWVLAIGVAPLTKTYGFVLSLFSFKHAKTAKEFAIAITAFAFVILVLWGPFSISYTYTHFYMQFTGNNAVNYPAWPGPMAFFNLRYITPFLGILVLKYWPLGYTQASNKGEPNGHN